MPPDLGFPYSSLRSLSSQSNRPIPQDRMHASYAVDDLRDPQIDAQAGQGDGVALAQAVLRSDQLDHRFGRQHRRFVEIFVKAEGDPAGGGFGVRSLERQIIVQAEVDLDALHRAFDGGCADLAVALRGVTVADREQAAV